MSEEKEFYLSKQDDPSIKRDFELKKDNNIKKKKKSRYLIAIFLILSLLTFIAFQTALSERKSIEIPKCGDGSFYETCSLDKPYYCADGILTLKASICGCGNDPEFYKQDEKCITNYNTGPKKISLKYVLNGEEKEINFEVYKGVQDHVLNLSRDIYYYESETPFRVDFKIKSINDKIQRQEILKLVKEIQNIAPNDKVEQARIAISLVQNIPYGFSNKTEIFEGVEINHSRYPYEVLYENKGICGEKSQLLALLLKELGYGVSIFYFSEENHEAVGIKCPVERSLYGSGFCFVETGGNSIITDSGIEFASGITLNSRPEILLISEGISLPDNLPEYKDAEILNDIRQRNLLGFFKSWKLDSIKEKYGLVEVYELS